MARTWSLLSVSPPVGSNTITVMHDPQAMGWRVGDRIQIAPTTTGSNGFAETYFIRGFGGASGNTIQLSKTSALLATDAAIGQVFKADALLLTPAWTAQMQAEVINLSRNVIITGDDFTNVPCVGTTGVAGACLCDNGIPRTQCTMGLHTIMFGGPGVLRFKHVRVEKCGQRGILGRYCSHFHLSGVCPGCVMEGNAYEYGHQRGTVVHATHQSTVTMNVYSNVRGAMVYVEDGNEMYNVLSYNVAVCPFPKDNPQYAGCTQAGTDNGQADTDLNQSGFWGVSFQNYLIGNRAANNFNGMLYQGQGFENGRQSTQNKECINHQLLGRMEGNTWHGHGRFGTYVLVSIFPKKTDRSATFPTNNGYITDFGTCKAFDSTTGADRGAVQSIWHNTDYDNVFVGQYSAGDIAYVNHFSVNNNNNIYWKETKNFADGCTAHLAHSYYSGGNMALPGGHGAFLMENVTFSGRMHFECGHHCGVGVTGVLCHPTYVFINTRWSVPVTTSNGAIVQWADNNGGMFTLSPPECANPTGHIFPPTYCSVVSGVWTYLLALDGGATCKPAGDAAAEQGWDRNALQTMWRGGIMCKAPVRRLEVFTFGQKINNPPANLTLQLWQNNVLVSAANVPYYQIGDDNSNTRKQGYALPVIPTRPGAAVPHRYVLQFVNGSAIPRDWIVEFSDPVFGNRWSADSIQLSIPGRTCPAQTSSQHDRKFIWYDSDNYLTVRGRGACQGLPDEPAVTCSAVRQAPPAATTPLAVQYNGAEPPSLSEATTCPQCAGVTSCPANSFCDCGTGSCMCKSGFSGPDCSVDICDAAGCDPVRGACAQRYLGGTLAATEAGCACVPGSYGPRCNADPCAGVTCSGRGTCQIVSATEAVCTCNSGWHGPTCNSTCNSGAAVGAAGSCEPACYPPGMRYYAGADISGAYNNGNSGGATKEACAVKCVALGLSACGGFAWNGNTCYWKTRGPVQASGTPWAGLRCNYTDITVPQPPVSSSSSSSSSSTGGFGSSTGNGALLTSSSGGSNGGNNGGGGNPTLSSSSSGANNGELGGIDDRDTSAANGSGSSSSTTTIVIAVVVAGVAGLGLVAGGVWWYRSRASKAPVDDFVTAGATTTTTTGTTGTGTSDPAGVAVEMETTPPRAIDVAPRAPPPRPPRPARPVS